MVEFPINQVQLPGDAGQLPLSFAMLLSSELQHFLIAAKNKLQLDCVDSDGDTIATYLIQMKASEALVVINRIKRVMPDKIQQLLKLEIRPGYSLLNAAIEQRREDILSLVKDAGLRDDIRFEHGQTKLHLAVRAGDFAQVEEYLKVIPVDAITDEGMTPLMLAAGLGNERMVEFLLSRGANPNRLNIFQQTALHCALATSEESAAIQLMIVMKNLNGADRHGMTPLILAAREGHTKALSRLHALGADATNACDEHGLTALHFAALKGKTACIETLIAFEGVNINAQAVIDHADPRKRGSKDTALHLAAQSGHVQACKMLILKGADHTLKDANGFTPMDLAFFGRNPDVIKLFSHLVDFNDPSAQLNRIQVCLQTDNVEMLERLIVPDFDVHGVNEHGQTALHFAAMYDANRCAEYLIGLHCSVGAIDHEGNTPLHYAALKNSQGVIHLLVQAGADVEAVNHEGKTALILTIEKNNVCAIFELILSNADLNHVTSRGELPIVIALSKNLSQLATTMAIMMQRVLIQNDFVGQQESLRHMPVIINWMQKISDIWKFSQQANDTILHLAVRLNSTDSIHLLAKGLPTLFSSRNAAGQTPQVLAAALKQTDAQNALALHRSCEKMRCTDEMQSFWRVSDPIQKTPEQILRESEQAQHDDETMLDDALNAVGV